MLEDIDVQLRKINKRLVPVQILSIVILTGIAIRAVFAFFVIITYVTAGAGLLVALRHALQELVMVP
jgi:hypothetical protein